MIFVRSWKLASFLSPLKIRHFERVRGSNPFSSAAAWRTGREIYIQALLESIIDMAWFSYALEASVCGVRIRHKELVSTSSSSNPLISDSAIHLPDQWE